LNTYEYRLWEIVEVKLVNGKKDKNTVKGEYRLNKTGIHHTVNGKGCIGKLTNKK